MFANLQFVPLVDAWPFSGCRKCASIGDAALFFNDASLGCEICEELYTPNSQVDRLHLAGVEIISNGSGSLHEVKKLNLRLEHIQTATKHVSVQSSGT